MSPEDVSRETLERLEALAEAVRRWQPVVNLVSSASLPALWERHIRDSAQLLDHLPAGAATWVDLGSGGGFPGLVVAIVAAEKVPDLTVTLVDSDQRKAAFLQAAARDCGLRVNVQAARAEALAPLDADVISARALAPLERLLGLVACHLGPGGTAILPKGAQAENEIAEALASWTFQVQRWPSVTSGDATILVIEGLARA